MSAFHASVQGHLIFLTNRLGRQLSTLILEGMDFDGWKPQGTHLGIMADLMAGDGLRQQDLAINSIKDKATIARGLSTLERQGIVRRETDPTDRRQKRIFFTAKGHRLRATVGQSVDQLMESVTGQIPAHKLAVCTEVLGELYTSLQQRIQVSQSNGNE